MDLHNVSSIFYPQHFERSCIKWDHAFKKKLTEKYCIMFYKGIRLYTYILNIQNKGFQACNLIEKSEWFFVYKVRFCKSPKTIEPQK